jgi:hypothetical protein
VHLQDWRPFPRLRLGPQTRKADTCRKHVRRTLRRTRTERREGVRVVRVQRRGAASRSPRDGSGRRSARAVGAEKLASGG